MRNLTPPFLLQNVDQGQQFGHFEAVVLFVDTSGFTPLTARLSAHGRDGAEVLAEILLAVFEPLTAAVYAHGGYIAGFAGDAFKAIFPGSTPESYRHALAAAEQIRTHMLHHPTHETRYGLFEFRVRLSLAAGQVTWAIWSAAGDGMAQSHGYTFGGPALDQAIQGEDHAEGGELVVTRTVFTALQAAQLASIRGVALTGAAEDYLRVDRVTGGLPAPQPVGQDETISQTSAARFYPLALLNAQSQGEFRPVYTIFVNTQRLPQPGADDDFMPRLFQLLHQYGGHLCRIGRIGANDPGGTFLIFWGAPTSHENDLERALAFLLALRAGAGVALRAGVTHAVVYAGFVGSPLRAEYTCYGSRVNQAARQMGAAQWGQILLDEAVARRAQDAFAVALAGQYALKGLAGARPLFALQARRQQPNSGAFQTALVGRAHEVAQLRAALQPILANRYAGLLLVSGEAGVGKSHLVHDALPPLNAVEAQIFHCATDEILRESLNPLRYFLRRYFEQAPEAAAALNQANFAAKLGALIAATSDMGLKDELARGRSCLGALINLYWDDSLYAQLEPQLRFENTLSALKTLLLAASLRQPLILVLEDVHWLDADSAAFLTLLTRNVVNYPLAIIATSRLRAGDETAVLPATLVTREIPLSTLAAADVAQLARANLGGAAAPALIEWLTARTDGNPFYVEQLLRYLHEQALLREAPQGWRLAEDTQADALLPDNLQTVLVARLDRLVQMVREVVLTAAVLGREFSVRVLSQMLRSDPRLEAKVELAQEAAIWLALGEVRYLFRHALLRDAAYAMQLRAHLRTLHRSAAAAIELLFAANLPAHYADLVYHYGQAGDAIQEQKYARLAGEQAAARYENQAAVVYLSRALDLTPAAEAEQRYQLLQLRESVFNRQGDREKQAADLDALATLTAAMPATTAEGQRRRIEVLLSRASYENHIGDYAAATSSAQAAMALANESGQRDLAAAAIYQRSLPQLRRGEYAAVRQTLAELPSADPLAQISYPEARILNVRGIVALDTGDYVAAQPLFEQANVAFQQLGKLADQAGALGNLALLYQYQNQPAETQRYCEAALALFQQIGHRRGHGNQLETLGNLAVDQGEFTRALTYFRQSLQLREEVADRYGISVMQVNLGFLHIRLAALEQARRYLEPCLAFTRQAGAKLPQCYALNYLAYAASAAGDYAAAQTLLDESLPLTRQIGAHDAEGDALCYGAAIAMHQQQHAAAAESYGAALAVFRGVGHQHKAMEPLAGLAALELLAGDLERAMGKVEEILAYTATRFPTNIPDPFQIYWRSYGVLQAAADPRGPEILRQAHNLLQTQAAAIEDTAQRHAFLHNVASHQAIIAAFRKA
ncbi:MAG: AAA family ATPase [Caldilineaceae bacterium]